MTTLVFETMYTLHTLTKLIFRTTWKMIITDYANYPFLEIRDHFTDIFFRKVNVVLHASIAQLGNEPFLCKMLVLFFISNISLYMKEALWKNCVTKWNLKCTPQLTQNSFSREWNLKFCIIFNIISFANA